MKKLAILLMALLTLSLTANAFTQINAEHILVGSKAEALLIKSDIESGRYSFEEAAAKYSKCPSGKNGGGLGYFGQGQMVKEFEDAAVSLPEGQVSDPVKTQFGWHLIKVLDKR